MQILLTKYWVLAHLLILAGIQLGVPTLTGKLMPFVWASLSAFLVALLLPPVRQGETFLMARARTGMQLLKDAFFPLILLGGVFLLIQSCNNGRELVFQEDIGKWVYSLPRHPGLPSSVPSVRGVLIALAFFSAFFLTQIQRIALVRKTRAFFLIGFSFIGGILAASTFIRLLCAEAAQVIVPWGFFSIQAAGVFHVILFCVSFGCVAEFFLEKKQSLCVLSFVAFVLNFLGGLLSFSMVVISLTLVLNVLAFLLLLFLIRSAKNGTMLVPVASLLIGCTLPVAVVFVLLPQSPGICALFLPEVWTEAFSTYWDNWLFRIGLAWEIWLKQPFLGVGLGGYTHFSPHLLQTAKEWAMFKVDPASAGNDFVQFLCENGVVGFLLLLLPVLMLIGRCLSAWVAFVQGKSRNHEVSYRYLFLFIGSLIGLFVVFVLSLVGTPFHEPGVLFAAIVVLGCLSSWMPALRR